MVKLFSEFSIKNLIIKNRIVMAPMCMYVATHGFANDWHLMHYGTRAQGGVGMIIMEATGVEPRGRITEADLGLWSDDQIPMLKRIVEFVHEQGAIIGIQLNHAGRKSQVSEDIIAPSAVNFPGIKIPKEMSLEDIKRVVSLFKEAALRALKAGFDFIEIHGAHGYLINQFLSPITNQRTDLYGGSIENRARFLKEIVQAIRFIWPKEKLLILRISAEEYVEDGNHPDDLVNIINLVKDDGIDMIDVSSGGVINVNIKTYPGYQLLFGEIIKTKTNLPVIGGGLIFNALMAEESINNHNLDFIFLGRELLRNPYFPLAASKQLNVEIDWPKQYLRSRL